MKLNSVQLLSIEDLAKRCSLALPDLEAVLVEGGILVYCYSVDEDEWLPVTQQVLQDAIIHKPNPVEVEFILSAEESLYQSERQPIIRYDQLRIHQNAIDEILRRTSPRLVDYEPGGKSLRFKGRLVRFSEAQAMIFAYLWSQVIEKGRTSVGEEEIFNNINRASGSNRINDIFKKHDAITLGLMEHVGPRLWSLRLT